MYVHALLLFMDIIAPYRIHIHVYTVTLIFNLSTHILSSDLSMPYAKAAAVGSLITRRTFSPAIWPASLVACGKVMLPY